MSEVYLVQPGNHNKSFDTLKTKYNNVKTPIAFSSLEKAIEFIVDLFIAIRNRKGISSSRHSSFDMWLTFHDGVKITVCGVDEFKTKIYNGGNILNTIKSDFPHLEAKLRLSENMGTIGVYSDKITI